jgi:hypothetical protein
MVDERFLGQIITYNPDKDLITIKTNFITEEKKEILFNLFKSNKVFSFVFRKAYKESKTSKQIRTYFMLINQILTKLDIVIDKYAVNAMDKYIMENLYPCQMLNIFGQEIPCVPSKADLDIEEFSILIQTILDTYSELNLQITPSY